MKVINDAIGDAISDMLAVLAVLQVQAYIDCWIFLVLLSFLNVIFLNF